MGDAVRNYDSYNSDRKHPAQIPPMLRNSTTLAGAPRAGSAEPSESATALL